MCYVLCNKALTTSTCLAHQPSIQHCGTDLSRLHWDFLHIFITSWKDEASFSPRRWALGQGIVILLFYSLLLRCFGSVSQGPLT